MAQVIGVRDTANIQSAKMKIDMSEDIALLQPEATPLITMLKRVKSKTQAAKAPEFKWLEDDLGARWDKATAAKTSADTTVAVANGDYFTTGDVVKVPRTGEAMLVTAVASNALTVVRGYGVTAAAAIVDTDPLVIIGNANAENSGMRDIKSTLETPVTNFTQIWKTPFGVSNTENATEMYGGSDLSYQQKKKGIEHLMDMNRSFYFGEKKYETLAGKPRRATGGLLSFLNANNYDASGQLTEAEFDNNVAEKAFLYGSGEKLMLCSARLLSVINSWGKAKLQINQDAKKLGLNIVDYITPFGVLHLVHDRILEGAIYGGYGVILDMDNIRYRPLQGRDTKLETNIQSNDTDGRIDQYITEAGLEVRLPKTHMVLTGVTS